MGAKLTIWGMQEFGNGVEFYNFLRDILYVMEDAMMDDVHQALKKNQVKMPGLPNGVRYIWDQGDVVGVDFGEFKVNRKELGDYLVDVGWVKKAVVYYL